MASTLLPTSKRFTEFSGMSEAGQTLTRDSDISEWGSFEPQPIGEN
jgi:hypothetical protein